MNDLEQRLHDLLAEDSSHAPLVGQMPTGVRTKVRRRQVATTAIAALTALAVIAGSAAVFRSVQSTQPEPGAPPNSRPVFERTATIGGLTTTSPSDWYLINDWAWNPDSTVLSTASLPLLQLTNFDPGLSTPVCDVGGGERTPLPPDGVAIFVSVGNNARAVENTCEGSDAVTTGTTGAIGLIPYRTVITIGSDATEEDRAVAGEVMNSMQWGPLDGYLRGHQPGYVLDGWGQGSDAQLFEARPSKQGVKLTVDPGGYVDANFDVPVPNAIQGDAFGAVTQQAAGVEFHRAGVETPLEARLIDIPPSLNAGFDAYAVLPLPTGGPYELVAIGEDGKILGSNLPPLTETHRVGTVQAFGTTWAVKYSESANGYYTGACVEPAATASPSTACALGWGGGLAVQAIDQPGPAVFVSQVVGGTLDSIEVVADDGRVFHAVMVPIDSGKSAGGYVAVVALEGSGPGRFVYHMSNGSTDQGRRPEAQVDWPDLGQVIGAGSFPPPDSVAP